MINSDKNLDHRSINLTASNAEIYELYIAVLLPIIGIGVARGYAYLGAALAVLGLWIFVKHYLGRESLIGKLFPKKKITTDYYQSTQESREQKNLLLLLPRQFYLSGVSKFVRQLFQFYLYAYTFSVVATIFWLYSKHLIQQQSLFWQVNAVFIIVQLIYLCLVIFIEKRLRDQPIDLFPSVLDKFRSAETINNLHILITPGNRSALNSFIHDNEHPLATTNTFVVNLSPFCHSTLQYIKEEGIILVHDNEVRNVPDMDIAETDNKMAISDLIVFKNNSFPGLSLIPAEKTDDQLVQIISSISR